jgi:hypothetical protein
MKKYSAFVPILLLLSACGGGSSPPQTDSLGPGIIEALTVNGTPAYKLSTGQIVLLDKPEETQAYLDRYPPPVQPTSQSLEAQSLPTSVDLSQYQTPVKHQFGRGTCTNFAAVAAIEAQYKRQYGLTLDLSEQWVTHLKHMMELWLDEQGNLLPPSRTENAPGPWDGGSVTFNLQVFSTPRLGIPLENEMPYDPRLEFGDTSMWNPPILGTSTQRAVGDLNLSQQLKAWNLPSSILYTTILPQNALQNAKYGANQVLYASESEEKSLDWFKTQLAGGHEVAFGVLLDSDDPNPNNDVWEIAAQPRPDTNTWGGHAMLMVGYDDTKKAFRVKNSWGSGWGDNGYVWMSYDFVTKGKILDAAVVRSVRSPDASPPLEQLFLGRYKLNHDGWRGELDIYHIPGIYRITSFIDTRLGTYYGPDGKARRVNGTINGRRIDFYIDWNNTGARNFAELSGMHYTGYLAADNRTLAGSMLDNRDGKTYGFYGHKMEYLSGMSAGAGLSLDSYVGNWQVYGLDIPSGSFSITSVNASTGAVTGKVFGGSALTGTINTANPQLFSFELNVVSYQGYLFSHETGVMAGTAGLASGFIATRSEFSAPQVNILSPGSGDTLYRTQSYTLSGQAIGDNGSGFNVSLPCNWTSSDAGDNQFPITGNCTPTIKIRPGSPSSVTITLSATAYGGKSAQTSVTLNVQNPPNSGPPIVNITEPANGSLVTVGSLVTLKGSWVGGTPPYRNFRWTWQATHKTGCAEIDINAKFYPPVILGQVPYWTWDTTGAQNIAQGCGFDNEGGTLRLYVTDDLNQTGSASIVFKLYYVPPPH